jgi:hypothetical protein
MLALQVPKLPWDLGVEYSFWGGLGGLTPIRPLSTPLLLLTQKKKVHTIFTGLEKYDGGHCLYYKYLFYELFFFRY